MEGEPRTMDTLLTTQTAISVGALIPVLTGIWWAGRAFGKINDQIKTNSENIEHLEEHMEQSLEQAEKICTEKINAVKNDVKSLWRKSDDVSDRMARVETHVKNINKNVDLLVQHTVKK